MLKKTLLFLLILFSILFFSALHIGLTYILPYPFSKLNLIFVLIVLLIVWWESGWVVWVAFFAHIFIELFSLTPFGLTLFAATIATLFSYWLYEAVITNRSSIATAFLCVVALGIYRSLYVSLLFFSTLFGGSSTPDIGYLLVTFLWEMVFSASALLVFYFLAYRFVKRFRTQSLSLQDVYGS